MTTTKRLAALEALTEDELKEISVALLSRIDKVKGFIADAPNNPRWPKSIATMESALASIICALAAE